MKLRRYDSALSDLGKVIELAPNHAIAYNNRGYIYSLIGDVESAINNVSKAIALNPEYAGFYKYRAELYKKLDRIDLSEKDIQIYKSLHKS